MENDRFLVLDIGSSKTSCALVQITSSSVNIISYADTLSLGVEKGNISVETIYPCIKRAYEEVKRTSGDDITVSTIVSISGAYTQFENDSGVFNIIDDTSVNTENIKKALDNAVYNCGKDKEYDILHVLPYNFKLDERNTVDPLGMKAQKLEVEAHIVYAKKYDIENLKNAVRKAGLQVINIVLSSYASLIATVNDDEKKSGVLIADMGADVCDIAIYSGSSLKYTNFIPYGSSTITNDLFKNFGISKDDANDIKCEHFSLSNPHSGILEAAKFSREHEKKEIDLQAVHQVCEARADELLGFINEVLEDSELANEVSIIVLTGGLASLEGIEDFASNIEDIFNGYSLRVGLPFEGDYAVKSYLKSPDYACLVGLAMYKNKHTLYEIDSNQNLLFKQNQREETVQYSKETGADSTLSDLSVKDSKSKDEGFVAFIKKWFEKLFFN